jgi:hypothetical protein
VSEPREIMVLADIRFPLERANGVQIVKTAAALARAGSRVRLVVRRSDPRPTPEVLALFGVEPHPCLEVRRLRVLHRRGSFILPRASFLARAAAAGLAVQTISGVSGGGTVVTEGGQADFAVFASRLMLHDGSVQIIGQLRWEDSNWRGERLMLLGNTITRYVDLSDDFQQFRLEGEMQRGGDGVYLFTLDVYDKPEPAARRPLNTVNLIVGAGGSGTFATPVASPVAVPQASPVTGFGYEIDAAPIIAGELQVFKFDLTPPA